jgi:hypothetical protein
MTVLYCDTERWALNNGMLAFLDQSSADWSSRIRQRKVV